MLTRLQAVQLATKALHLDHPVRWVFKTNPLRLVSPMLAAGDLTFRVTLLADSRWWPTVTLDGPKIQGSFRVRWPFCRLATFLRERLRDWYAHEQAQRELLVATLQRLQERRRSSR